MKKMKIFTVILTSVILLTSCGITQPDSTDKSSGTVKISLSGTETKVDGMLASTDAENAVYLANDIIYYEDGKDFTYGEGTQKDAHSKKEADEHTVVHITKPGTYSISGTLPKGQIAIDLGKDAKNDPDAVVTLILNGVDITCEVAPAIIFYNVYECGSADTETATKDVDTSNAGANVIIADGSENIVNGSYVARIYKSDSVVLNEDGTEVEDAKKLHKYDAAFYSKMSMNINGESANTGTLTINAENEGLDSELHLTINGGIININSGNDGINTNEDEVSVTTLNGGKLNIKVTGETGEGDGIDSNGWLVINGGTLTSQACGFSMDGGIDSDMGIHINGGTVIASGNMLDRISESNNTYAIFNFGKNLGAGVYSLKNSEGVTVIEQEIENSFTSLIISSPDLVEGDYTLWYNDSQLVGAMSENGGMFGGMPGGMGQRPEGMLPPEDFDGKRPEMPDGERPEMPEMPEDFDIEKMRPDFENMTPPENFNGDKVDFERGKGGFKGNKEGIFIPPENATDIQKPQGQGNRGNREEFGVSSMPNQAIELSEIFTIKQGANYFSFVSLKQNVD